MPFHKIVRGEEIPTSNWHQLISTANQLDYSKARKIPGVYVGERYVSFQCWLGCVLAVAWLTGKRIDEILRLKRDRIRFSETQVKIRFHVGKKKTRSAPIELFEFQKTRTINHQAVPYIQQYLKEYDLYISDSESYLFLASTEPYLRTVNTRFVNGRGEQEVRRYSYECLGGYVRQETARGWLAKVNCRLPENRRIYFHYARHNIGIKLAYEGASPLVIAEVLDETPNRAIAYTKHAAGLSNPWTQQTE